VTAGQIHDLGYKRYVGSRRAVDTRWTVIMRHQIASSWKTWWRYKIWLVAAMLATAVAGGFLYFASGKLVRMIGGMSGQQIGIADAILPLCTLWYGKVGFIVSLTISATVVAGDVQSGAFTFYFARSVRPRDYVIGKLVGLGLVMALIMLVGPLVLACLRLGLSDDLDQLVALAPILYKALVIGVLGTLIYTAVPLGFSAVVTNRRYAVALWAAYDVVIGNLAHRIGETVDPAVGTLDLPSALAAVSYRLFNVKMMGSHSVEIPIGVALGSILGHAGIAIGLMFWRVRRAQRTGVGGSS
jgi:hypothetical protein